MPKHFASFFNGFLFDEIVKLVDPRASTKFIYRDELNMKKKPSSGELNTGDCFGSSKLVLGGKDGKSSMKTSIPAAAATDKEKAATVMRVKVKMTKEEAARLLSKCKEGGVLEFKEVARSLVEIPVSRVTVGEVSAIRSTTGNTVLESIPE